MNTVKFVLAKNVPKCPKHKGVDLVPEQHPIAQEGIVWYFRCTLCNCLYTPDVPGMPQ